MDPKSYLICILTLNFLFSLYFINYLIAKKRRSWQIYAYLLSKLMVLMAISLLLIRTIDNSLWIIYLQNLTFVFSTNLEIFSIICFEGRFRKSIGLIYLLNVIAYLILTLLIDFDSTESRLVVICFNMFVASGTGAVYFLGNRKVSIFQNLIGYPLLVLAILQFYRTLNVGSLTGNYPDIVNFAEVTYMIAGIAGYLWMGFSLIILMKERDEIRIRKQGKQLSDLSVELELINDKLEVQNKALGTKNNELRILHSNLDSFVYKVSHDLKAPIVSLLGLINLIKKTSDYEEKKQFMTSQEIILFRMVTLIKNLLNYARNPSQEITREEIDLLSLAESMCKNNKILNSEITYIINNSHDCRFWSDKGRTEIIVENILSNAFRFASKEVKIEIEVNVYNAKISIEDDGCGIEPEYRKEAFKMFSYFSEEKSGSGLGLYIAKELATKLKGNIYIDPERAMGTRMVITLPNMMDTPSIQNMA